MEQGLLAHSAKLSKSHTSYAEPVWKQGFNNNLLYFSAVFQGTLSFHVGKEHSNVRLPQETDTSGQRSKHSGALGWHRHVKTIELEPFRQFASRVARCQNCFLATKGQASSRSLPMDLSSTFGAMSLVPAPPTQLATKPQRS